MNDIKNQLTLMRIQREREEKEFKENNTIDIEKIKQEKLERQKSQPDIKPDCLSSGWFIYIFIMIGGLIFVDYIYLAIFATVVFFAWRHNKIEEANGRKYDD